MCAGTTVRQQPQTECMGTNGARVLGLWDLLLWGFCGGGGGRSYERRGSGAAAGSIMATRGVGWGGRGLTCRQAYMALFLKGGPARQAAKCVQVQDW